MVACGAKFTKLEPYSTKITTVPFHSRLLIVVDLSKFIQRRTDMAPKKSLQHSSIPIGKSEKPSDFFFLVSDRNVLMVMVLKFSGNCEISIQGKATCHSNGSCLHISASENAKIEVSGPGSYLLESLVSFYLI